MNAGSIAQIHCELFVESVVYMDIGGWASYNIEVKSRIHCPESTIGRRCV